MFLGLEQNSTGTNQNTINFATAAGWDFPVGRDAPRVIFSAYGTDRHNYMVIGKDGRIAYRATTGYTGAGWSTYKAGITNAINAALLVPVEPTTWSRLKSLLDQ